MLNLPEGNIASGAAPWLVWHNGLSKADTQDKGRFSSYVGWATEVGRNLALDAVCAAASITQMRMRHLGGNETTQWALGEELAIYPLTAGPVVTTATLFGRGSSDTRRRMADAGLVAEWPAQDFEGRPGRSHVAFRGIVPRLWDAGFRELVEIGARGMMTDYLLTALADHAGRVRLAVAEATGETYSPPVLLLTLAAGADVTVGKEGSQSTITTIRNTHPTAIDADYARSLIAPEEIQQALSDAWDGVVAWARTSLEPPTPMTPRIAEGEPMRQIAAPPNTATMAGRANIERGFLDMRDIAETTASGDELEMIRIEALDARNNGRITVVQQAEIAKLVQDRITLDPALAPTLDAIPF